jgi:hypothetical protein
MLMLSSTPSMRTTGITMVQTASGLEELSKKLNPTVGFYDPLGIVAAASESDTEMETLGFYRHAEIKHGRVAMAAFVGFCVQSNGICFPWALTGGSFPGETIMFSDIAAAGGPADQWDALPTPAKVQILLAVGFLEVLGELSPAIEANGEKHYVKGGKPGYYPPFAGFINGDKTQKGYWPHPLPLNLWDPFGFTKKMTPERKEKALLAEINNGRLAMIGIFGMISASKGLIVPGLDTIEGIKPYAGEYMAPFTAADASLPFVTDMLEGTTGLIFKAGGM